MADRMRGLYENKIRFFCAPEKIFEIFASNHVEGKLSMSYKDFFKAVTPFCYVAPKEAKDLEAYFKRFSPKTLDIIDCDKSGSIEFTEFVYFILLLQVPINTLRKQFLKHPDQMMDHDQFSQALRELRKKTITGNRSVEHVMLDARTVSATEEEFLETNRSLTH